MRIVLLGPPGAGKGTQAVMLAQQAKIPHISTGDILRNAVAAQSALGKKAKSFMDSGSLVPDTLVIDLIRERFAEADCANGFLLDGFPRTVDQAKALTVMLNEIKQPLTHVIEVVVPEAVIVDRIKKRGESGSGRSDDTEEVAKKRYQVYLQQTAPVTAYYKTLGPIRQVDGVGAIDEVKTRLINSLK